MNTSSGNTHMEPLDPNCAQWYALHVRCNQEKNVAQSLDSRRVERFLPCYSSRRRWKDRQVTLEMPLFPGYLFVRLPLLERSKALLAPYVISLVGARGAPAVIEEEEIENIRRGLEHGKVEPHDCLHVGQHVVIVEGIMAGMEGILLRKQNRTRVVVSLDSIARAFAVEVDAEWVKPRGHRHSGLCRIPPNRGASPASLD